MSDNQHIPVVLFAYARPEHLRKTLEALRENEVPLIYAFSDGPRDATAAPAVAAVREVLRQIDWCEVRLCERTENFGLGRSIRAGVSEVLERHESVIVFEDDLVCVPGTYRYLSAALRHYRDDPRVMSVTGWTHPRITPAGIGERPYFDGRAECLLWGAWARTWRGMDREAAAMVDDCRAKGIDPYAYGADVVAMAEREMATNIWAVRFIFHHRLRGGLCLRPPHSLVEHIGWDPNATNAKDSEGWQNPPLRACPPIPSSWPVPQVHPACSPLWQAAVGGPPAGLVRRIVRKARRVAKRLVGRAP